jgi:ribosome silencing factor RsfS/YbeB/iojap
MTEEVNVTAKELAEFCAKLMDDKKAENVSVVGIENITLLADYFVVCTGNSHPHLNALAEWIRRKTRETYNIRPLAVDGTPGSEWIVVDYGNVIIHIFSQEARDRYQIEELWSDTEKLEKLLSDRLNEIQ